jgi:hypothetical protein
VIHAPNIVHETLDGETIIIHLDTGDYYSLTGSGSEIWALLGVASSASEICAELARRHTCPEEEIRDPLENFIADLEREGLVEYSDASPNSPPAEPAEANGPWEPPKLERYDDMRDFLLVDPIHETGESGWPSRQASQTAS